MPRSDYVEVYPENSRGKRGFRSRFVRLNGEVMATGAERYESASACADSARFVFGLPWAARKVSNWKRQTGGALRWYR